MGSCGSIVDATAGKGRPMKFKLHHMNLCADNVSRLSEFYRSVFDLGTIDDYVRINTTDGYGGKVDFLTDGAVEFHLARRDLTLGFRMEKMIHPVDRGPFRFRIGAYEPFQPRLE